jgi:hypothetical protein
MLAGTEHYLRRAQVEHASAAVQHHDQRLARRPQVAQDFLAVAQLDGAKHLARKIALRPGPASSLKLPRIDTLEARPRASTARFTMIASAPSPFFVTTTPTALPNMCRFTQPIQSTVKLGERVFSSKYPYYLYGKKVVVLDFFFFYLLYAVLISCKNVFLLS